MYSMFLCWPVDLENAIETNFFWGQQLNIELVLISLCSWSCHFLTWLTYKVLRKQFVSLIKDQHFAVAHISNFFVKEVIYSAWCGNDDVHFLEDAHDVVFQIGAACCDHDTDIHEFCQFYAYLRSLKGQLPRRHYYQSLYFGQSRIDQLQYWDAICTCLSCKDFLNYQWK